MGISNSHKDKIYPYLRLANKRSSPILTLFMVFISFGLIAYIIINPLTAILSIAAIVAWVGVGVALLRLFASVTAKPNTPVLKTRDTVPIYSVLVPLFREANMVEGLITTLSQLHYPKDKLEIFNEKFSFKLLFSIVQYMPHCSLILNSNK